jgi:hypothetical protein
LTVLLLDEKKWYVFIFDNFLFVILIKIDKVGGILEEINYFIMKDINTTIIISNKQPIPSSNGGSLHP